MNLRATPAGGPFAAKLWHILLLVLCIGSLGLSGAEAYPACEGDSGIADGIAGHDGDPACPADRSTARPGALQPMDGGARVAAATVSGETPAASCGKAAPDLYAQVPMGAICRWGVYFCYLVAPLPVGTPCCCNAGFCGWASLQ